MFISFSLRGYIFELICYVLELYVARKVVRRHTSIRPIRCKVWQDGCLAGQHRMAIYFEPRRAGLVERVKSWVCRAALSTNERSARSPARG
jgi:hypothetical protein